MTLVKRVGVALATIVAATFIGVCIGGVIGGYSKEAGPFFALLRLGGALGAVWGIYLAVRNKGRQ